MQTTLVIMCILLLAMLAVSLYYNYKHAVIILNMVDEIEASIEILDSKYASISGVLDIPLFYDSPQIRQVHNDINDCRNSVLRVASMLGNIEEEAELQQ